jgi:PAS domain S-box-containing protein
MAQILPAGKEPVVNHAARKYGDTPVIVAPLILENQVVGTASISAPWLGEDDTEMVAALADHIAIAIGNARYRASMRSALELERLQHAVVEAVASELDLEGILDQVLGLAVEATGADVGSITLIDEKDEHMLDQYLHGFPEDTAFPIQSRGEGVTWEVIDNRRPLLLEDYAQDPRAMDAWRQVGVKAYLGLPLIVGDIAIGAISVMGIREDTRIESRHVHILQAISHMAAVAIRNAKLLTEATRRAEEAQALMQTARSVSASLDYERVLKLIAEQAKALLRADASRIHILDPKSELLRCLVALDPIAEEVMALEIRLGEGLVGHVAKSGEPLLVNDPDAEERGLRIPGTPTAEPETLILVPLAVRQRTLGVMTVRRLTLERPFTSADVHLLSAFAAHAAVAIEHSHLFNQIQAQAQRLESEVAERTRELALSEARYRALIETSLAGIMQLDPDAKITYANQALAEIIDMPVEDIVGNRLGSFRRLGADSQAALRDRLLAQMRGNRPTKDVFEVEIEPRGERAIPCLLAASVITDDRSVQGMTALILDISDRKALEAALQSERDRLETILASIGDAVMVTDPEGRIEYVNPGWTALTGYSAEEAIGRTSKIHKSGEHSPAFYRDMWETILDGRTWRGEVINRRKDGSTYDAAVTIQPLKDDSGEIINFVGVQHDISALKEIDRLKSQFVSDVSHELRTPLTNIQLYLDLIGQTEEPERASRYLETLARESDRLRYLIDDLLSLSRLEAGTTGFEPSAVDLRALLAALVADRRGLAAQKDLELVIEAREDLPAVLGDERLLSQVFTNLLTNAMNYTPSGGEIVVRIDQREGEGGSWVTAEVTDTGLGIPAEERPRIFQRFFRGYASQNTQAPGTGLGLAICREIIQLHSGRIEVESQLDAGTTFTVWMPIANEDR